MRKHEEADTWWHPPSEEFEQDNDVVGVVESCGKRANPDRSFLSSGQHKVEVSEEVAIVTEIRGRKPLMDIATQGFGRSSWDPGKEIGVAV